MQKNTLIAVVMFGGLMFLTLLSQWQKPERGIRRISFTAVKFSEADKITIKGADKKAATLIKHGDEWQINGRKADQEAVKHLLDSAINISSSNLLSSNKDRYPHYAVDDKTGAALTISTASTTLAQFVVGKAAQGGSYIRVGQAVYNVKKVFPTAFSRPSTDWLDKTIFNKTLTDIEKVDITIGDTATYTLLNSDEGWELASDTPLPNAFRFDTALASRLISSLIGIQATNIIDDPGPLKSQLDDTVDHFVIYIKGEDSAPPIDLVVSKKVDTEHFLRVKGRKDIYKISNSAATSLQRQPVDFRDLKIMSFDSSKVINLVVIKGKNRVTFDKKEGLWALTSSTPAALKGFILDPNTVDRRVAALLNARATTLANNQSATTTGILKRSRSITATLEDKTSVTLTFGKEHTEHQQKQFYARGNADTAIYNMSTYSHNNLTGLLETFKQQPAQGGMGGIAGLDPQTLQNLPPEIRQQLMQQLAQQRGGGKTLR